MFLTFFGKILSIAYTSSFLEGGGGKGAFSFFTIPFFILIFLLAVGSYYFFVLFCFQLHIEQPAEGKLPNN